MSDPRAKLTNEQLTAAFKKIGVVVSSATIDAWVAAGVPTDPRAKLPRKRIAAALTAAGFPTSPATLGSFATRGGGPPFCRWGMYALYEWGSSLLWAEARLSKPRRTTSEGRELDRAALDESEARPKVRCRTRKTRVAIAEHHSTAAE